MFLQNIHHKTVLGIPILFLVIIVLISRSPLIVDDVHPSYECPALLEKADVLYVTPILNGNSIVDDEAWCDHIISLNKTLGMHGITHSYHEFEDTISTEDLQEAIDIFEECFEMKPTLFRPPYNAISYQNRELVESFGMQVYQKRYVDHPYCHCKPNGYIKVLNWLIFC